MLLELRLASDLFIFMTGEDWKEGIFTASSSVNITLMPPVSPEELAEASGRRSGKRKKEMKNER